jgi:hypothetical protein
MTKGNEIEEAAKCTLFLKQLARRRAPIDE